MWSLRNRKARCREKRVGENTVNRTTRTSCGAVVHVYQTFKDDLPSMIHRQVSQTVRAVTVAYILCAGVCGQTLCMYQLSKSKASGVTHMANVFDDICPPRMMVARQSRSSNISRARGRHLVFRCNAQSRYGCTVTRVRSNEPWV